MPPRWGVWARLPSEGALIAARVPGGTECNGEAARGYKGESRTLSPYLSRNALYCQIAFCQWRPSRYVTLPVTYNGGFFR